MQPSEELSREIAELRGMYATTWHGKSAELEAMGEDEIVWRVLADANADPNVVAHAMWLAPRVATREIAHALLNLVKKPHLAGLAADALIEIKDSSAVESLEQILLDETLPIASRAAAAEALGWLSGAGSSGQVVISLLRANLTDPVLAQAIIDAASLLQLRQNRHDCTPDIAEFLHSPWPDVRATALRVLGNMRATDMLPRISALLGDGARTSTGSSVGERAQVVLDRLGRNQDPDEG